MAENDTCASNKEVCIGRLRGPGLAHSDTKKGDHGRTMLGYGEAQEKQKPGTSVTCRN